MKEVKSCDLCGGTRFDIVVPPHSYRAFVTKLGELTLTIGAKLCQKCGFVFLSPRMDKKELDIYYRAQSRYTKSFEELKNSAYAQLCKMQIELIKRYCGNALSRALEVGSAEGYFLYLLSKEGILVEGVEAAVTYKDFCKKHFPDIKTHWTMFENFRLTDRHFSLCVMRHLLEHVESPVYILKSIYRFLENKGYLYIEVPNLSQAQAAIYDYFHEQHLSYFTPQTVRYVCQLAGFVCILVEEWNDNPRNSGFNYPVLRVIAQKNAKIKNRNSLRLNHTSYTSSNSVISNYFQRRNTFFIKYIDPLKSKIIGWHKAGKRIALFGGGPHTADLLQILKFPKQIFVCAFDNDHLKWGKQVGQIPIVSPKEVNKYSPDIVVISSREFENEISTDLKPWHESCIRIVKIYNP